MEAPDTNKQPLAIAKKKEVFMITGNMNLDLQTMHRHDAGRHAFLHPEKRTTISIPIVPKKTASPENLKLTAALSIIYAACNSLVTHYSGQSENQKKKAHRIKDMAWFQMRKTAKTLNDFDLMQIGARIDTLNTRLGFDNQPSWMIYISFCIAILSDSFQILKNTPLSERRHEIETIMDSLQDLHNYMTKKAGADAAEYDRRACELYRMWEDIF